MAITSVLSMSALITGNGVNETYNILAANPFTNPNSPGGGPLAYALTTGLNTIAVPPGAIGFVIIPPVTSVVALTLKGISGDTGINISPTLPTMLALATGATDILINAATPVNVSILWL